MYRSRSMKRPRMPHMVRHTLVSVRDLVATAGPFLLLALVLLVAAYWLLDPAPPESLVGVVDPLTGELLGGAP